MRCISDGGETLRRQHAFALFIDLTFPETGRLFPFGYAHQRPFRGVRVADDHSKKRSFQVGCCSTCHWSRLWSRRRWLRFKAAFVTISKPSWERYTETLMQFD